MASTRVSSESVNHQLEQTSGSCTNDIVVPPSSSSIANNAQPIGSTSKTKQNSELKTAKQWTYYIETLKRTVDCIYEMCRKQHSVIGCKEALMYLSSSVRDFESLIETINVEVAWEVESRLLLNLPHAVAWEIRKTMSPPGNVDMVGSSKDAETLISMLNLLVFNSF
ncbi:unnamed protein product [Anisakis simplex]|uniref:LD01527p (inferred by orthology to a D. melanogaster protein) n=1 Tax=Anisakis simplex TaxID=6269 RepID=A0A0M3KBA3_ANISI|nr:unnamed protein product [Anisakis simplex]